MQSAKLQLSPQHIALVTNAEWILTKNEILKHIKNVFEELCAWQQTVVKTSSLPGEVLKPGGKISRGENYLGLPWIVLDNPRCFTKENIFAIRTLFWWGRSFSTTLHVSGKWKQHFSQKLIQSFHLFQSNQFAISYNGDEWVHDVSSASYISLKNMDNKEFEEIIKQAHFIKMAVSTSIENIETSIEILMQQFQLLINIVKE
ncbi:hypothetical protein [Niabella ginsengisoli]|uniref:Uncharacterized protein n=1 Tax=Niabella ginsengisoli TaxID=522298 RepID=A0ABS9SPV6_9BACT|nr:hypothetical protein [Niabella ginsengisoli]MCH5600406.1 hypothetical protein [Niabella ginsengisoli]